MGAEGVFRGLSMALAAAIVLLLGPLGGMSAAGYPVTTWDVSPPDERSRISPTTSHPWSTVVRLAIYEDDDGIPDSACSGVVIDDYHVLTAGHCISDDKGDPARDYMATRVLVLPATEAGPEGEVLPYGTAFSTELRALPGWIGKWSFQHDLGLVTLERDVGSLTGWMPMRTGSPSDAVYVGDAFTAGYPGDRDDGRNLYFASGRGCEADDHNHWFTMDSYEGQSGSPVWVTEGGVQYMVSILSFGEDNCNGGTRLSVEKLGFISAWVRLDGSAQASGGLADLVGSDGGEATFVPSRALAGITPITLYHSVTNAGALASSWSFVAYYASRDPTIEPSDDLVGLGYVGRVEPTNATTVHWSGVLPPNLQGGPYYIGWIADGTDAVPEGDEGNNIGIFPEPVMVEAKPLDFRELFFGLRLYVLSVPISGAVAYAVLRRRARRRLAPGRPPPAPQVGAVEASERRCPRCRTPATLGINFCIRCGEWLE